MTLTLDSATYEELWQEGSEKGEILTSSHGFEFFETWKNSVWQRCLHVIELRSGLRIDIGRSQLFKDCHFAVEHPHSYPLTLAFQLSGKARVFTAGINPNSYYEGSGENYLFSVAGTKEIEEKFANQTYLGIRIRVDASFFKTFDCDDLEGIPTEVAALISNQDMAVFHRNAGQSTPAMRLALQEILNCPYRGIMKQLYLESKVLELMTLQFAQLVERDRDQQLSRQFHPQEIDRIHQAKAILIENCDDPPTLVNLARQVGLSDRKLKQGFRACFGTTAFKYLHDYRMERARELLAEGEQSVAEVANAVGYSHLSHFAAAFRRKFGINPSMY
ncbi:MAG: helix-turn-helix transcriptional regulator [Spirulinaceae cyanobacterium]